MSISFIEYLLSSLSRYPILMQLESVTPSHCFFHMKLMIDFFFILKILNLVELVNYILHSVCMYISPTNYVGAYS